LSKGGIGLGYDSKEIVRPEDFEQVDGNTKVDGRALAQTIERIKADRKAESDGWAADARARETEVDDHRSLPDERQRKSRGRRQLPRQARAPRR
jgi:hypothetical protein